MKFLVYLLAFTFLVSCNTPTEPEHTSKDEKKENQEIKDESPKPTYSPDMKGEVCWKGFINKKIPVFIHYSFQEELIVGEIVYLKTKLKTPIRLLGDIRDDHFRLVEYDKKGNVTGVIIGNQTSVDKFEGRWTNLMDGDLTLELQKSDTTFEIPSIGAENVYGDYGFDYGDEMDQGSFSIKKVNDAEAAFRIGCVGMGAAPNIAQVETDTIIVQDNGFKYTISDNCELGVKFYKDFVYVKYTNGDCAGQFGAGTGVDGVYIKK